MAQPIKNPPTMQDTQGSQVRSLCWEDSLEGDIPLFLPEKSHGQRSLVGYNQKAASNDWAIKHTAHAKVIIWEVWSIREGKNHLFHVFSSVQLLSHVRLFATPWIATRQASLSITHSWSSLRLKSIESVMPSSHLILCHPLFLLPPVPPSIRVFSSKSL